MMPPVANAASAAAAAAAAAAATGAGLALPNEQINQRRRRAAPPATPRQSPMTQHSVNMASSASWRRE